MSKSHVGMGYHVCPVCGCKHAEIVLLDKHLRPSLEAESFVGLKLCAEHQIKMNEGYIALVEAEAPEPGKALTVVTAIRTGKIAHIAKDSWTAVFNCPVPTAPMAFVDKGVLDMLVERYVKDVGEEPPTTTH